MLISDTKLAGGLVGSFGCLQTAVAQRSCSFGDNLRKTNSTLLYELSSASNQHSCIVATTDRNDVDNFAVVRESVVIVTVKWFKILQHGGTALDDHLPATVKSL